jgi:N12 class adenine-specific DNA methylase
MTTIHTLCITSLITLSLPCLANNPFQDLFDEMDAMMQRSQEMHAKIMQSAFSHATSGTRQQFQAHPTISEDPKTGLIKVAINNIELTKALEITINESDNSLAVEPDNTAIQVSVNGPILDVEILQTTMETTQKDIQKSHMSSSSSSFVRHTITSALALNADTVTSDYNKATKTLTIALQGAVPTQKISKVTVKTEHKALAAEDKTKTTQSTSKD